MTLASVPPDMPKYCGQCRRALVPTVHMPGFTWDDWLHRDDNTPRCAQGTADAVRGFCQLRWCPSPCPSKKE